MSSAADDLLLEDLVGILEQLQSVQDKKETPLEPAVICLASAVQRAFWSLSPETRALAVSLDTHGVKLFQFLGQVGAGNPCVRESVAEFRVKAKVWYAEYQKNHPAPAAKKRKALPAPQPKIRDEQETRSKACEMMQKPPFELADHLAAQLDAAMRAGSVEWSPDDYHRRYLNVKAALKRIPDLVEKLRSGKVTPGELVANPEGLKTEDQRERERRDREAAMQEAVGETGQGAGAVSSGFTCPACSHDKAVVQAVQTGWHNAQQDETVLACCAECSHRWKLTSWLGGA
mmetsp:Transcript_2506/g.5014  ORF Transcript_2506/g.5014 Transcript_2506/m.5014 type:complete len:288 (+) Transcript_2506:38-901(+)